MGMFKSAPPKAPDYSGIAAASEKSAQYAYQASQDQLAWAKEQYGMDRQLADGIIKDMRASQARQDQWAIDDRNRYKATYQPLEDQLVADAQSYNSPTRQRLEAQKDMASVATQFDASRDAAQRNLESFGVDPSSTRYAALDAGSHNQQAAVMAGAGNQAIARTDAMGKALRSEAINIGKGYPGQAAVGAAGAVNAGTSASGVNLGTTASGQAGMGTAGQWQGLGNQALGQWGNTLNTGYNNQMARYQAQNSGWGTALGAIAGLGSAAMMMAEGGDVSGDLPMSTTSVGVPGVPQIANSRQAWRASRPTWSGTGDRSAFRTQMHDWRSSRPDRHDGGGGWGVPPAALPPVAGAPPPAAVAAPPNPALWTTQFPQGIPITAQWGAQHPGFFAAADGGGVPMGMSPSYGVAVDDVPARLTVGEFVIPKDVKDWKGEEFFHKLIAGSRQAKAAPKQAQPTYQAGA